MCIRDRGYGADSLIDPGEFAGKNFSWLFVVPQFYRYRYACLLYTSDAADERSSVDLGGRRIIEKKKQKKEQKKKTKSTSYEEKDCTKRNTI